MATRCRGYRSRRLQAFQDNPQFLIIRPAPPSAGINDFKPLNLSTVLMAVHKYCYTSLKLANKAAPNGGRQLIRRRRSISSALATHILFELRLCALSRHPFLGARDNLEGPS